MTMSHRMLDHLVITFALVLAVGMTILGVDACNAPPQAATAQ